MKKEKNYKDKKEKKKKNKEYFTNYIWSERNFLLQTVSRLFPNVPTDKREDFVEETLLNAYNNLDKFDKKNVRGWLTVILKNVVKNSFRQSIYAPTSVISIENENNEDWLLPTLPITSPEDDIISKEIDPELQFAFNKLKPKLKEVFKLYINGYKYKEIAQKLKISIGTVMSRMNRARIFLKKEIRN